MKRYKKITIITIITLLVVILISTLVMKAVYGVSAESDTIYGFITAPTEAAKVHNKEYKLSDYGGTGNTVKLIQKENRKLENAGTGQKNALNQTNIFCIQRGVELDYGEYSVSTNYTVTDDKVLEYILANAMLYYETNNTDGLQDNWADKWQMAIWYYVEEAKKKTPGTRTQDENNILNSMDINKIASMSVTKFYDNATAKAQGRDIYYEAVEYANNTETGSFETSEVTVEDNKASFTLTGNYDVDNLTIKVNNEEVQKAASLAPGKYIVETEAGTDKVTIDISDVTESELRISVSTPITKYTATYRVLKCVDGLDHEEVTQGLLVATGASNEGSEMLTHEPDPVILNTEVSLQKYITKVNDVAITTTHTEMTDRKNKLAREDATETIKEKISTANTATSEYKKEKYVNIEAGDIVTYKIEVYNNATIKADTVLIRDQLPEGCTIEKVLDKDGHEVTWTDTGSRIYEYTINNLNAGDSTYFDVYVKFNEHSADILTNKAWINQTEPANKTDTYRTEDEDYVKMPEYSVSLVKFVSEVNGEQSVYNYIYDLNEDGKVDSLDEELLSNKISGAVEISPEEEETLDYNGDGSVDGNDLVILIAKAGERELKPIWPEDSATADYKEENKVGVEIGDEVTYTLKLTNTDDTIIKVTEIVDVFDDNADADIEYVDGSVTGYGNASVAVESGKLTITIANPEEIPAGESKYLTLKFRVKVNNADNTKVEQILKNTAEVTKITNKNGYEVTDSDGIENNKDSDWIKTNTYAVSLEKFISAKNGNELPEEDKDREGKAEYLTKKPDGSYVNETESDSTWTRHNTYKQDNVVTVSKNDIVTYTIKVTNDGETPVYVTKISDKFPSGVKYDEDAEGEEIVEFTNLSGNLLEPGESASFNVDVKVVVENGSMELFKNTAKIVEIAEKTKTYPITDSSPNDNEDSDYIDINIEEPPPPPPETTSYLVEKIWADDNNRYGKRPEKITVELHRLGEGKIDEVELNSTNNWKYEWTGAKALDKFDEAGNEYQYFVKEISVAEYRTTYTKTTNKTTIKNTYEDDDPPPPPELIDIKVQKYWENDNDSVRPESIKVQLYKNGVKEGPEVELNEENSWSHEWNNLEKSYTYDVKEIDIPEGYTVRYNGYSIYNKYDDDDDDDDYSSIIGGFVWNDVAQNKIQDNYDGRYQTEDVGSIVKEDSLKDIKVALYRDGYGVVATDYTDENGHYGFDDASLADNTALISGGKDGRYIKGPKHYTVDSGTTTWVGEYYSYYVIFEYDGVTYTSTRYNNLSSTDSKDSNAEEAKNSITSLTKSREDFNEDFEAYRDGDRVKYETVNNSGKIPQSIHRAYNSDGNLLNEYKMQSSTEIINMASFTVEEEIVNLTHINLGLRGRDIFDLELFTEVEEINVKINNVIGVYKYTNTVNLRKTQMVSGEDMANVESEELINGTYVDAENQYIRRSDISHLNEIKVTYKITVTNASNTAGTATKIINYYDSNYEYIGARAKSNCTIVRDTKNANNVVIELTGSPMLQQGELLELYIDYKLKTNVSDAGLVTYNMSEILGYKTGLGDGQTEYTRGLIDKDSASGSANKEQVRTTQTEGDKTPTTGGSPTTVGYYFAGNNLDKLKYEDDTYATPVIYTISDADNSKRKIEGYVFEDLTKVHETTRIKTGNGKLDENEVGVYGAKVTLRGPTTLETTTNADGWFQFANILPGEYTIEYTYGHNSDTILLGQADEDTNKESYNGEDYQSTNNVTIVPGMDTNVLNSTEDFWYVYNEIDRISTAKDDSARRTTVSRNILDFEPEDIEKLNSIRELIGTYYSDRANGTLEAELKWDENKNNKVPCARTSVEGIKDIINSTYMVASTKDMLITVEETIDLNRTEDTANLLNNNLIRVTKEAGGVYLGEWCIFPGTNESGYYPEYKIENMNFGIAKVPITIVDLQKYVSGFTITDATGRNGMVSMELVKAEDGTASWVPKTKGDVLYVPPSDDGTIDPEYSVSIEDDKLQGARLEITYTISQNVTKERDFNDSDGKPTGTIKGIVDFIDNNLSYNPSLGKNSMYWDIITYSQLEAEKGNLESIYNSLGKDISEINMPGETDYNTIIKLKEDSGFYDVGSGSKDVTVTLEKVLAAPDYTLDEILGAVLDDYRYGNTIKITGWEYSDTGAIMGIDRIRTPEGYIILPGIEHDTESAEILVLHPPTGDSNINITYFLIAIAVLAILALGVFGIKKFVIKK